MADWFLFAAFGGLPNLVALVLLVAGLRATALSHLNKLLRRAIACLVLVGTAAGLGALHGFLVAFGVIRSEATVVAGTVDFPDASQKAAQLAQGISEIMNCIAAGMICLPLPLAATIVIAVRSQRLARDAQSAPSC